MTRIRHKKLPAKVPSYIRKRRLKACKSGKRVFFTEIDANIFLTRMQLKSKNSCHMGYHKMPIRAYRCNYCGHYHVTSRAKWHD